MQPRLIGQPSSLVTHRPLRAVREACALLLTVLLAGSVIPTYGASLNRGSDAFLAGAITTIVERDWGWPRDSYDLQVEKGVAVIELRTDVDAHRAWLESHPLHIEGLQGLEVRTTGQTGAAAVVPGPPGTITGAYSVLGLSPDTVPFPVGDLFWPLIADPKQPQFFVSYRYYRTPAENANVAAVGYGETFGLWRRAGRRSGDGLQLSVVGGLFAQFNLDAPSRDLVNADYTIGAQVTYRNGRNSGRLRIYHQSSHLGDEFLLQAQPQRINLSFESLELLYSRDWLPWRFYAGGEYLFHREPSDLKPAALHGGVEFHGVQPVWMSGRWVGGVDIKSWQEHDWAADVSVKVGLAFGAAQPGRRRLRVMLEGYRGYAPHGQFYEERISYAGLGVYLGF